MIELFNYLTTNGVPNFAWIVDTENWDEYSDKESKVYQMAPYAYEISLKIAAGDEGYTRPNYNQVSADTYKLGIYDISATRPFAFHSRSTGDFLDLNKVIDIIDSSSVVAHRNMSIVPEIEMPLNDTVRNPDLDESLRTYARAFNNITAMYPRFSSIECRSYKINN
jgi:hypothetical protein